MIAENSGWLEFLGWSALKFLVITIFLVGGMLFVDPFYFDLPLSVAEAGMEPAQAPTPPFTTSVTFEASPGEPIKIALGARDAPTRARVEVLMPSGIAAYDSQMEISRPDGSGSPRGSRRGWQSFVIGVPESGSYTIRITQQTAGTIKIFLFQGPFVARLVFLPFFTAFLVMIAHFLRRPRPARSSVVLTPEKEV